MQVVAVIFLTLLLAGCDSFESLSDVEYVNRAQNYLDKRELSAASIDLKNALSQNPENPQARWLLGNLQMDVGNMPSAEKELKIALELGVSEESVLPLLAKTYLAQEKYEEALDLLKVQSSLSKEARASLLTSQGIALLEQDDPVKASESIESALRVKPDLPYALYGEALVVFASGDLAGTRASLDRAFEYDPEYAQAWSLLGDLERRANNPELAEQAYGNAIKNSFNVTNYLFKRALMRIQLQQFDVAQQDIDMLKIRAPGFPGVSYAQGLINFLQGKYTEAQESFELALRADGNYMPAVFYLGATHFSLKNGQQAAGYLSRYISENPGYMPARKLLAAQESSQQNYQRVEELIRPVVNNDNDDVFALNLLANALYAQGKVEEGSKLLERVSELQPESAMAKARLGVGLLIQGEQPDAVASFESAIELDPGLQQADILLIQNYLLKNEFDLAEQRAQDFITRQPDNPVAHNMLGLVYIAKQQQELAKVAFTKAVEVAPGDPAASQNLAALATMDSKPEEARDFYQQILKKHEGHLETLLKLAMFEAKQGDENAMRAALERAMVVHPDAVQPRVYLARNYLQSGNPEKALEVLGDLDERYPDNVEILGVMGELQMLKKDYSIAKVTYSRLVQIAPASAEAHYKLAQTYVGLNKKEKAEEELVRTLELAPGHLAAFISLTRLQLRDGRVEEARKNLVILKGVAADNPYVLAIEADLSARSGEKMQAMATLEQRFQTSPSTESLLEMSRYMWGLGKQREAIDAMEQWTGKHPGDVAVHTALAHAYSTQGRIKDSTAQYERILEISENNIEALNNLAWQLRKTHPERALAYAEKASTLAPESAAIMDTLSELLLAKGELALAERWNTRSLDKNPASSTFLFRKASILVAADKPDEAVKVLKKILVDQQDFPERADAEAMLARLGG